MFSKENEVYNDKIENNKFFAIKEKQGVQGLQVFAWPFVP